MSSDFFIQSTNLLAQQLSALKGEEIYTATACMDSEIRELIGVLEGIKAVAPNVQKPINKFLPLICMIGKAKWIRSELTDLGLRVGQKNFDEISDTEINPDAKLSDDSH
jgi:hypothetical protein